MQEEVDEKTVALVINGGKISGRILKAALEKMVHGIEEKRRLTGSETEAQRKEKHAKKAAQKEVIKIVFAFLYKILHAAPVAVELYDTARDTDHICHYKGIQVGHLSRRLLDLKAHPAGLSPCSCFIFEFSVDDCIADLVFTGHLIELFISPGRKTDQSRVLLQPDRIGKIVIFSLVINGGDGKTAVPSELEPDILIFCPVFIQDRLEEINSSIGGKDIPCPELDLDQVMGVSVITQERMIAAVLVMEIEPPAFLLTISSQQCRVQIKDHFPRHGDRIDCFSHLL